MKIFIKALSLILAATLSLTLLASCGTEDTEAPLGFKEISSDDVTYDLFIPEEWTADISTGVTSAYFSGQDPSNISLIAFELDGSISTVEDYWAAHEPDLKALFSDLEYVGEPDEGTLDGVPAVQYTYTGTMSGVSYKFMQLVAFKDATVYIFTYTATAANYDTHIEEVIEILKNFKFH